MLYHIIIWRTLVTKKKNAISNSVLKIRRAKLCLETGWLWGDSNPPLQDWKSCELNHYSTEPERQAYAWLKRLYEWLQIIK